MCLYAWNYSNVCIGYTDTLSDDGMVWYGMVWYDEYVCMYVCMWVDGVSSLIFRRYCFQLPLHLRPPLLPPHPPPDSPLHIHTFTHTLHIHTYIVHTFFLQLLLVFQVFFSVIRFRHVIRRTRRIGGRVRPQSDNLTFHQERTG